MNIKLIKETAKLIALHTSRFLGHAMALDGDNTWEPGTLIVFVVTDFQQFSTVGIPIDDVEEIGKRFTEAELIEECRKLAGDLIDEDGEHELDPEIEALRQKLEKAYEL